MNRTPRQPRGPRIPTWLLASGVIAAFVVAGVLFFSDTSKDTPAPTKPPTPDRSSTEDELTLPKDDDQQQGGAERRGDIGRERQDGDSAEGDNGDEPEALSKQAQELGLPPAAANLRGKTIAVVPASAGNIRDGAKASTIGGLRSACDRARTADQLAVELSLAARVSELLDAAGATTQRFDTDGAHEVACPAARMGDQEQADLVVVLEASDDAEPRALAGRAVGTLPEAERRRATALAAEFAARLGVKSTASVRSDAQLLTDLGALDAPGGGSTAYVRVRVDDETDLDALALDIVSAFAAAATVQDARATTN